MARPSAALGPFLFRTFGLTAQLKAVLKFMNEFD